jgi:hypothetical protein
MTHDAGLREVASHRVSGTCCGLHLKMSTRAELCTHRPPACRRRQTSALCIDVRDILNFKFNTHLPQQHDNRLKCDSQRGPFKASALTESAASADSIASSRSKRQWRRPSQIERRGSNRSRNCVASGRQAQADEVISLLVSDHYIFLVFQ